MSDPSTPSRRRVVTATAKRSPAQIRVLRAVVREDETPEASYLEQEGFEERLAEYKRGEFSFVGVRLEAEVTIAETTQTLLSPGLWSIENDIEQDELERVVGEEWEVLRVVLKTVGVPTDQLPLEFKREWIEWRT